MREQSKGIESLQDWKLVIVGDGERKPEVESKIHAMALEDSVMLKPFTTVIDSEYLGASIYAMCSKSEGFPLVFCLRRVVMPCRVLHLTSRQDQVISSNPDIVDIWWRIMIYRVSQIGFWSSWGAR